MTKSLRYLFRTYAQYIGMIAVATLIGVLYAHNDTTVETKMFTFRMMAYLMLLLFLMMFPYSASTSSTPMALSFGATRRGWFGASIIAKALFALVSVALVLCVVEPLGMLLIGAPVAINIAVLPMLLGGGLFISSLGGLLGNVAARFGAKVSIIIMAVLVLGFAIGGGIIGFLSAEPGALVEAAIALFTGLSPVPFLVLAALCVPFEVANWFLLRKMAVRG